MSSETSESLEAWFLSKPRDQQKDLLALLHDLRKTRAENPCLGWDTATVYNFRDLILGLERVYHEEKDRNP